ncbi:MAG: 2Fe-2S iron-sulfur cluster-binding protein, partial [Pseudomonadota bacterium]
MSDFQSPRTKITLNVNGARRLVEADPTAPLVETLRQDLRLKGTHVGCQSARCGACLIEVDGAATKACTLLTGQAEGAEITTIEGVAKNGALDPLQETFRQCHALQCGYCTPGMVMAVRELLRTTPAPSDSEIRTALKGNLCRCTGYQNIVKAVRMVIGDASAGQAASPPETSGVGAAIPRVEDERFLTGRGQYCADIDLPGQAHAAFVRSVLPHAEIVEIDTRLAAQIPGVIAILTGADVAKDEIGLLRCG